MNKISQYLCCGCGTCAAVCPRKCIVMKADSEGFCYPAAEESQCVNCGKCRQMCPENQRREKSAFQPYCMISNLSDDVERSSSGGIFPAIARNFIHRGGWVTGAGFTEDFQVIMKRIGSLDMLPDLRMSKYVQAAIPDGFFEGCRNELEKGCPLFFCGTPCQVAAFLSFLNNRKYPNLLTGELICHGVPSPLVWKDYLRHIAERCHISADSIDRVCFRDKTFGWHKFALTVQAGNQEVFREEIGKNLYMRLFLADVINRPSCGDCRFKAGSSGADITLGDFWKLRKIAPELDNDSGASLVLIHTETAHKILSELQFKTMREFPPETVRIVNRAFYDSFAPHPRRDEFFRDLLDGKVPWDKAVRFVKPRASLWKRIFRFFSRKKR